MIGWTLSCRVHRKSNATQVIHPNKISKMNNLNRCEEVNLHLYISPKGDQWLVENIWYTLIPHMYDSMDHRW